MTARHAARNVLALALAFAVQMVGAVPSAAQPAPPQLRTIPHDVLARVRAQPVEPGAPDCRAADREQVPSFEERHSGSLRTLNLDDDTSHYARGSTLVCNIFVDHGTKTWSFQEEFDAGAKAQIAKDYFALVAPQAANLSFDNGMQGVFYSYNATLPYALPDSTMTWFDTEIALQSLGFSDVDGDGTVADDASISLQNVNGGFDNVLLVFQPADHAGRAHADYDFSRCVQFIDDSGNVFAHEWGHLFGSCDEYEEDGQCGGGMDCGPCQSWYLDQVYDNYNCDIPACSGLDVGCLMRNNTFSSICLPTLGHWAWLDFDNNGQLDSTKRRIFNTAFGYIYELWNGGLASYSNTTPGWVTHQSTTTWAVVGVRSPPGGNSDVYLYGDNNYEHNYASSTRLSGIDFVVGDYNHTNLGNEHFLVAEPTPAAGNYTLQYESGTALLLPDGSYRTGTWGSQDIVRVWDVPLFAGETVLFTLETTSGSPDLGMALFNSNGAGYWAGRTGAVWEADAAGAGGPETRTFTAPADDVYGLVVWSNSTAAGTFRIQIGPPASSIADQLPHSSSAVLAVFGFSQMDSSWSAVGTRPNGSEVTLRLTDALTLELLETSDTEPGVELIAVKAGPTTPVRMEARVSRESGSGIHQTNYDAGNDVLTGIHTETWITNNVAKVWDATVLANQEYFVRGYHGTMDTGLYLFSDANNSIQALALAAAASNSHGAGEGEWLSFTSTYQQSVGIVQVSNAYGGDTFQNWFGPRVVLAEGAEQSWPDEVVWGIADFSPGYWAVVGAVSGGGANLSLYTDEACTIGNLVASDQAGNGLKYVVGDFNHAAAGTYYARMWQSGSGSLDFQMESGAETIVEIPGQQVVQNYVWLAGDLVQVLDLYLTRPRAGNEVLITLEDGSGVMDLGLDLFDSQGVSYFAAASAAAATSDVAGTGGTESVVFSVPRTDWYGLVITNKNASGGAFRVSVGATAVSAPLVAPVTALDVAAFPSPFRGETNVQLSLPRESRVTLTIHDVAGRAVRSLASQTYPAGRHALAWDGRDDAGARASAGVYFARVVADGDTRTARVMLVR